MRLRLPLLAALLVAPGLPGCSDSGARSRGGSGAIGVEYTPAVEAAYPTEVAALRAEGTLDEIARGIDGTFRLPRRLTLTLDACGGVPNAFYEADGRRIRLCIELVDAITALYARSAQRGAFHAGDVDGAVANALRFVLFHEAGHALVHVLDLPITGREEDVADQLATLMLDDGTEAGALAALSGAQTLNVEPVDPARAPYWDEHGLGPQRFYNVVCWVYGRDPEARRALVSGNVLPAGRAARCPGEYERMWAGWRSLLGSRLRGPARHRR
jgi:hypothetical protein